MPKLSLTQEKLLAKIGDGILIRWQGGFWTAPDTPADQLGANVGPVVPEWYFSTNTVRALIDKGFLVATKSQEFYDGTLMPTEVRRA